MQAAETELDLAIGGMTCAACVRRVERAIARVPGVLGAEVNLATERARIRARPAVTEADLQQAIRGAGYAATAITAASPAPSSLPSAMPVIAAALLCASLLPGMIAPGAMLPSWLQAAVSAAVVFGLGARFFVGAWRALRAGAGSMEVLVALGATAAWTLSAALWLTAGPGTIPDLYFESAAFLVTFVLFGKWLEARAKRQAVSALHALAALRPDTACRLEDGVEHTVPLAHLRPGDRLLVRPGERIPVDGRIDAGEGGVDLSLLTGESLPATVGPGDRVTGGALNLDGRLVITATALGAESTLARIIRAVEGAQASKPPIQRLVDRVAAIFVPAVIALAALTFAAWCLAGAAPAAALLNAVAVVVIACPCALGLATPAAIAAGTGVAARHGILIRDAEALERAHAVDLVAFDKTGTLTEGRPVLASVQGDPDTLNLAAALLAASEHPLATAVRAAAPKMESATRFKALPGRGVAGAVAGRELVLGSARLMAEHGLSVADPPSQTVSYLAELAPAPRLLGRLTFADTLRPSAKSACAVLAARGIETALLTGDTQVVARAAAAELGIAEVRAGLLPQEKADVVQSLRQGRRAVAMVGDGINDAPALAAADLGIAMGEGTDLAQHVAAITLIRSDLALVPAALAIARRTRAKIRQGLFWAFAYNVVGIPLAAAGLASPALAAAAMALSSVSVLANALLLRRVSFTAP